MNPTYIYLFHIFFASLFLIYIGYSRDHLPKFVYFIVFVVGMRIETYHMYLMYSKLFNHDKSNTNKSIWANLIHVCLVGPILIYIGYNKEKTPRFLFEITMMLGFAALGYHSMYLLKTIFFNKENIK